MWCLACKKQQHADLRKSLESAPNEKQSTEVHQRNVGNFALRGHFGVEFEAGRGVRVVYGDGLENRCPCKGTVGSNPTPSAILKLK